MSVFGHIARILFLVAACCSVAFAGTYPDLFSAAAGPHRSDASDTQLIPDHKSGNLTPPQIGALTSTLTGRSENAFLSPELPVGKTPDIQLKPENKSNNLTPPQLSALTPNLTDRSKDALVSPEPFDLPALIAPPGETPAKWTELQSRILADEKLLASCLSSKDPCSLAARRFLSIVDLGRKHQGRARLGWINRAVNLSIRPMSDWAQYGYADYWASPLQTLSSGAGDCEDYAIVKYVALRHLGFTPDDLRLVIVRDNMLGVQHAVVAVRFEQKWVILDNRTMAMLDAKHARHYYPLFVMDDRGVKVISTIVAHS
jgi:predicted transglutaminase-like cysteine proteinase